MSTKTIVISLDEISQRAIEVVEQSNLSSIKYLSLSRNLQIFTNYLSENHIVIDTEIPGPPKLSTLLEGANLVVIVQTFDSHSSSDSASYIGKIAQKLGALSIAFILRPHEFENEEDKLNFDYYCNRLMNNVDCVVFLNEASLLYKINNNLYSNYERHGRLLLEYIKGIRNIINVTGIINIDSHDTKQHFAHSTDTIILYGKGNTVSDVVFNALNSTSKDKIIGAQDLLINITTKDTTTLWENTQIVNNISSSTRVRDPRVIFGVTVDNSISNNFQVFVLANNFSRPDILLWSLNLPSIAGIYTHFKDNYDIPALMRYKSLN